MRAALAILALAVAPLAAPGGGEPPAAPGGEPPVIGAKIGPLDFVDTRFLPRSTSELTEPPGTRALVLALIAVDCPVAQRYLPRLAALEREYRPRGARFAALGVAPSDELV